MMNGVRVNEVFGAIQNNPGKNTKELRDLIGNNITQSTVAAVTSVLLTRHKVKRTGNAQNFRYYLRDYRLPEGVEGSFKILKRRGMPQNGHANGHAIHQTIEVQSTTPKVETPAPTSYILPPSNNVLITIQWGNKEAATMDVGSARAVYEQLQSLFGGRT